MVLSHGHIDHHNGVDRVVQKIDHQGLPLILHPDAWLMRRAMTPTGPLYLPPPDRQHLEGGGVEIVETRDPSLHLSGPIFEPRIAQTVADLSALGPAIVVPAHCTGWRATHAIAAALPNAFIQNSVGTRYHLV